MNDPQVSIIIISYNTCKLTLNAMESIKNDKSNHRNEIIVVDNASSDDSCQEIKRKHSDVMLIELDQNYGFSKANNIGIKKASGQLILLLNSDTLVKKGSISALANFLENRKDLCAVAPELRNFDDSFQRSFFNFPNLTKFAIHLFGLTNLIKALLPSKNKETTKYNQSFFKVDYVIFAAVMFPRTIFDEIGYLDEKMFFYHEDCEFGYRMKNKKIDQWVYPKAKIKHLGGGSSQLVSEHSFKNYFNGLLYVFKKHHSGKKLLLFKGIWFAGFIFRALFSRLGFYHNFSTPSTYISKKKIGNSQKNSIYYYNLYKEMAFIPFNEQ